MRPTIEKPGELDPRPPIHLTSLHLQSRLQSDPFLFLHAPTLDRSPGHRLSNATTTDTLVNTVNNFRAAVPCFALLLLGSGCGPDVHKPSLEEIQAQSRSRRPYYEAIDRFELESKGVNRYQPFKEHDGQSTILDTATGRVFVEVGGHWLLWLESPAPLPANPEAVLSNATPPVQMSGPPPSAPAPASRPQK